MGANEMTKKIRELKELQQMAEELQAEIIGIQDEIKEHMTAQGIEEMTVDVFKVRWTPVMSSRFDTTAFRATHAELYKQYAKTIETRRFSVA